MQALKKRLLISLVLILSSAGYAGAQYGLSRDCQILDRLEEPIWHVYTGYLTKEDVRDSDTGDFGIMELGANTGLLYYRTEGGELDVRAGFDTMYFTRSGGISLPTQVTAARADADFVMRFEDGYALRLKAEPGIYSDLRDLGWRDFFVPFALSGIRTVSPDVSVEAGIAFFPGFDRLADPRMLMRWELDDAVLLDAGYPGSRIMFRPFLNWGFMAGFEIQQFMEYRLKRSDVRRSLAYDETRFYIGVEHVIADHLQLMLEAGRVVNRSMDFRRGEKVDLDDAYYVRVGIGGLL